MTWDPHPEVGNREPEGVLATAAFRADVCVLARPVDKVSFSTMSCSTPKRFAQGYSAERAALFHDTACGTRCSSPRTFLFTMIGPCAQKGRSVSNDVDHITRLS